MTYSKPAEIEDESYFFPIHPVKKFILLSNFIFRQENSPANPDCSPRGLITESLINKDTSKHGLV